MQKTRVLQRIWTGLLAALMLIGLCSGCTKQAERGVITSAAQLNDSAYTIGVPEGAAAVAAAERDCPEAKLQYYSRDADAYLAVQQGKIDAFAYDRVMLEFALANGLTGVKILPENIGVTMDIAVGVSPKTAIPDLVGQVNAFLAELRADGTLDDMHRRWVLEADNTMPDIPAPANPPLTLKVGTTGLVQPFSYYEGDQLTGYDIEMIRRFAAWMNADVEIRTYDYGGIVAAAESGSIDCIMANLNATEERREQIDFSDTIYDSHTAIMVRDDGTGTATDTHASLETANYGVMTGSTAEIYIGQTYPQAKISTYSAIADAFLALSGGKIDYVLTAYTTALGAVRSNPTLEIYQKDVIAENVSIAVAKGNLDLLSAINGVLDQFKADGTLDQVVANWTTQGQDYIVDEIPASDGANGVLRVAVAADREPMCFIMDGACRGLDCELIERIAAELGMKVEYQNMQFGSLVAALSSGKADVIISNMTATDERRESVDFTQPYFANPQVLVAGKRGGSTEKDPATAVYGITSIVAQDYLSAEYPNAALTMYPSATDAMLALQSGKVDYVMTSRATAKYMTKQDAAVYVDRDGVIDEACYIAVGKEDAALRDQINTVLAKFRTDGTLDELNRRWTEADPTHYEIAEIPKSNGENGTLKVALSPDVPPICFLLNGEYAGIDVELMERIAYELGMSVEFTTMDFDALLPALQSGKADLALSDINATEERRALVDFTEAYFDNPQVIAARQAGGEMPEYTRISQLDGKIIAALSGSAFDQQLAGHLPNLNVSYYNSVSDEINALKSGKAEAVVLDEPMARLAVAKNSGLTILSEKVSESGYALVLPKGSDLTEQVNGALEALRAYGTLDALKEKWFASDDSGKTIPSMDWPGLNGTLRFAHDNTSEPMSYVGGDGSDLGYDVELVYLVAKELDMKVETTSANFDGLIPMIQSGKADIAAGCFIITPERQQMVDMTAPYYNGSTCLVVRTAGTSSASTVGVLEDLRASFTRTFVTEGRWKLILSGLEVTVLISICSGVVGALFGFVVCMARRSRYKPVSILAAVFIRIIQGTPIVVFLMILYYVIFGAVDISAIQVSVIGFSVNFGVYVSEMMRTGIDAVDKGQIEASQALGYNKYQTFRKITFPQAARHFLPVFKGEFISMVKMTSVVGYIAIQDLTKVSDIIRSRTLEAFFPLIATAVLYFIVANLLTLLLSRVEIGLDPKRRKLTLKGVDAK